MTAPAKPNGIRVLPMSAETVESVALLEQSCFSRPWSLSSLKGELQNPHAVFRVALSEQDEVAGYAGMHHIADEGQITNIAVFPAFRRRGVALALAGELIAYGRRERLAFLTLEVRAGNRPAIALYQALGFREVGLRPRYYSDPVEDALLMTLTLDHPQG